MGSGLFGGFLGPEWVAGAMLRALGVGGMTTIAGMRKGVTDGAA